jgi:diphthamide synthase (EF-2-diphthine--ammonia ligase)
MKEKVMLFWSGGKSCALALHYLINNPNYEVIGLISTINKDTNTIPFHGIPDSLLTEQAKMLKIPLQRIFLPSNCSDTEYIARVSEILSKFGKRGIRTFAFGDTDLDDVKKFKENMLHSLDLKSIFPLWGKSQKSIFEEITNLGLKALVTSIDETKLDKTHLNCEYNQAFFERIPPEVGSSAFHTFIIFGPGFKSRIAFSKSMAINESPYLVSLVKEP